LELRKAFIHYIFDENWIPGMENLTGNSLTICESQLVVVMLLHLPPQEVFKTVCGGKA
jgi:hypothetical protein